MEAGPLPREADHAVFERYGIESVVRRIDDLYERLLAVRTRSSRRRRTPRLGVKVALADRRDVPASFDGVRGTRGSIASAGCAGR